MDEILTSVRSLDWLIEDLLRYSRLDAETPTSADVDLSSLVEEILRDRRPLIAAHGIDVCLNAGVPRVRTWERGLLQILTNLIDNALKYTRDASPPAVHISSERRGDTVRIVVADNGIGFDMAHHHRIFGLFNRLVTQDAYEGTGAGLAIVKKITEKMGAKIWADSSPGRGATFYLELPDKR